MFRYIFSLLTIPGLYLRVFFFLKQQRNYLNAVLAPDIEESKKTNDGSLSDNDFNKMMRYYGYAAPAILGESFALLRGKKMSESERKAITYAGAITGLFDDFFDKKKLAPDYIKQLVISPDSIKGNTSNERLFNAFYQKILSEIKNRNVFVNYFLNVHDAQVLSKKQTEPDISKSDITYITYAKGGYSLLFYRSTLDNPISENEQKMLYVLGSILQLENDIFDIYKDHRDGIMTLATTCTGIAELRNQYLNLINQFKELVSATEYLTYNQKQFADIMLVLMSRGVVCMDQLESLEKRSNNKFVINEYVRKDLICDMEKPVNFLKTVHYFCLLRN